jgi:hypothetical protein
MDPHFIHDAKKAHVLDCQDYWGPDFVWNVKALMALGELVSLADGQFSNAEVPISCSTSNETIAEIIQRCARLYSDTYHHSEKSLDKLSSRSKDLANGLGPVS